MCETRSAAALLDRFAGARVLVLGDVMLDRYVYGAVERVSYEAPIPVLAVRRQESMLGGAGNVARNVAALGARAVLVGLVGTEPAAAEVRALMAAEGRIGDHLVAVPERPTTVKTRFIASSQQLLRADAETLAAAEGDVARRLLDAFRAALEDTDVVVLSDYAKGCLSDAVLGPAIAAAREAGKPVIVDPKSRDLARYRGADLLKPNRAEMMLATGLPCGSDEEAGAAARHVMAACGIAALLVSRAEQGVSLVTATGEALHLPAAAREVFDVSGAGDTMVATAAVALGAGADLADAARLANLAAGIVVGKVGTAVVRPRDLQEALHQAAVHSTDNKVVPLDVALDRVQGFRARGERVGFTNGCFDLIHPGHVALLSQARASCDRLIVAINSDASVRRLKGPERPVQNETARAIVLASLAVVDLVLVFEEDTPIPLLQALKPDVLVKGADYRLDQVVGAEVVRAYGGTIVLADLVAGHSTSGTIARMSG